MGVDVQIENDVFVTQLRDAIGSGEIGLSDVPPLLKAILKDGRWKSRKIKTGKPVKFSRFEEFVTAAPLEGLGADMRAIKRLCSDDPEILELIKVEITDSHGGDRRSDGFKVRNTNLENESTDDASYAVRRLHKERPDLHARVIAKELSPHAAMIEAGFRRKSITVPDDPEAAARVIRRHFEGDRLAALIAALETGG